MTPNRLALHIALAISVSLHLGVGLSTLISFAPAEQPISQPDRLGVFKTYMNSRIVVNAPQVEQKKVNEVEPPLVPLQNKEQAQVDTAPPSDTMEYRRSYSMFSRPRLSRGSQGNAATDFQQRYFAFQRKLEFVASSPDLHGECTVIASNAWSEFNVYCSDSQDVNFLRAELSSVAQNREPISSLRHCLTLRKNEVLKKENCAPLQ
ncbi:MAG: hypothetical protein RIQ36_363 [Pseudomonadota bacterium]|jgi:hypothetical protein